MADIYGSHFEYGGISSRQFSLIIVNVDTSRNLQLSGSKQGVTLFNKSAHKRYLIDDDYSSSPLSFEIEFVTENERALELFERRQIEKWLFRHRDYRKLYIDIADDDSCETYEYVDGKILRNYLNCRFINPEKIESQNGVVGYKATLEADSDMYWQDSTVQSFQIDNQGADSIKNITVKVDTDMDEYIYPKVTINMGSVGGDIIITNNSDDSSRLTKFIEMSALSSIVMNGEINSLNDQYYEKFYDRNFIRLLDGENKFTILGNVKSIDFEYSARRMM